MKFSYSPNQTSKGIVNQKSLQNFIWLNVFHKNTD